MKAWFKPAWGQRAGPFHRGKQLGPFQMCPPTLEHCSRCLFQRPVYRFGLFFLHVSRGLGQSQMLSPYSCLTRAGLFPGGAPYRTIPDAGQSWVCFQMFVHIAGDGSGGGSASC